MSILEFVAAMTSALAWPAVLGVVLVAYRRHLARWMAERPSRMKIGPVEAEWEVQLSRVEVALDQATADRPTAGGSGPVSARFRDVARSSPLEAIAEASLAVEAALVAKLTGADVADVADLNSRGMAGLAERAVDRGLISDMAAASVRGLSVMRGLAMHGRGFVTPEEAREFLALADATLYAIGPPPA